MSDRDYQTEDGYQRSQAKLRAAVDLARDRHGQGMANALADPRPEGRVRQAITRVEHQAAMLDEIYSDFSNLTARLVGVEVADPADPEQTKASKPSTDLEELEHYLDSVDRAINRLSGIYNQLRKL